MFNNLRSRLTLVFIGLAILPLLAVSFILGQRSFTTLEREALDAQQNKALVVGIEVTNFIEQLETELTLLSEAQELLTLDIEQQREVLSNLLLREDAVQELILLNAEGQEIIRFSRSAVFSEGALVSRAENEEFLLPSTTNSTYYSPVRFDESIREPLITLAIPMVDNRSGKIAFVLLTELRFKEVWNLFASLDFEGGEDVYMTDAEGRLVAHRNPSVVLRETTIELPAQDGRTTGLSETDVIFASSRIQLGNQELVVVAEQPYAEAAALALNFVTVSAAVTAIALVTAIGLVILIVRQIVMPIEALSDAAHSISEGNLTQRVRVTSQDEIGTLANAFNNMAVQLSDLIGNLESRVAERTRDLKIASDVSRHATAALELDPLLTQLVNLTAEGFDLYSVNIFLYGSQSQSLNLEASSGETDQQRKTLTFDLSGGDEEASGLVRRCARQRKPVIGNNVLESTYYLASPLLPGTRSEMVVPMMIGQRLVGVLDLQSEQTDRFSEEGTDIFITLAEQMATAVRNAQLYGEAESARKAAEEADYIKSQFLASMSHELRTPLNAVLNFTEMTALGYLGPVNEKQEDALNKSLDSSRHLLSLINDVLDITKMHSGMMKLFIEDDIDLNAELHPIIATAETLLKDKPVQLVTDIDEELPVISGDKRRIRQILLNLISNAAKFTEEGSVTLSAKKRDGEVLFAVTDTGPGIAKEDQKIIFEPFEQTDAGIRHAGGTGLGLPISKRLAEIHGGRVWLESEPGDGAAFYVTLPLAPPATIEKEAMNV